MFRGLLQEQISELEYEVINDRCRLNILRLFREKTRNKDDNIGIILKNRIINIARQNEGLSIYRLESDDDGYYLPSEIAWHFGELESIPKRQSTCELIETLCDLIDENLISTEEINEIFDTEHLGIYIMNQSEMITIKIADDLTSNDEYITEHPNLRTLVKRMDNLLENSDYSGVLHTSASIFETLAKLILHKETVENQTLSSFFDAYRKKSKLPDTILDMIRNIYLKRNTEPLAGHGSTQLPTITKTDAIIIDEMTKSFIKIERKLANSVL